MADEEKEVTEAEEGGGEKKKKGNPLLLVVIVVAVLLVVLIGVLVFMIMSSGEEEAAADPNAPQAAKEVKQSKTSMADPDSLTIGPMYELGKFTVNLQGDNGRRYLKIVINLEMSTEEVSVELEQKKPVIQDIVIGLLSSQSVQDISTFKGKNRLKKDLAQAISERLIDGQIQRVYFTDFVMQ